MHKSYKISEKDANQDQFHHQMVFIGLLQLIIF